MDRNLQSAWVATVLLGVVLAVLGLVIPVSGVVLAAALTLLVMPPRRTRVVGLGGAWLGFGGTWSAFLLAAAVDCVVGASPSDACGSPLFQSYILIGLLMAAGGVLLSRTAFRDGMAA